MNYSKKGSNRKMKCKLAIEEGALCGKNICCCFCTEKDGCLHACECDHTECSQVVQEEVTELVRGETELQVMESAVHDAITIITDITLQKQKLDEKEKKMRKKLLEAMETFGIKKFENDRISFTYVAPTTRESIDSTKLKKEYPTIAKECCKTSKISASVKISVKGRT